MPRGFEGRALKAGQGKTPLGILSGGASLTALSALWLDRERS
jgi:hypothetical protein